MFNDTDQKTSDNQEQNGEANTKTTTNTSSFDTLLSEIRNERGEQKYRSVEDGLNALKHSQEFIYKTQLEKRQLEDELTTLRQQAAKTAELEATVAKLTQRSAEANNQPAKLDEEALANLVDTRLSLKQKQETEAANQRAVAAKISEAFGDKAKDVFYAKASQMGLSGEEIEALSARSPKAVLTMFGLDGDVAHKQTVKSPAPSRVNGEHFQGQPSSFIGAETERVPLGGGTQHFNRILNNSISMVEELNKSGMSVADLTDPVNYMRYMKNKGN